MAFLRKWGRMIFLLPRRKITTSYLSQSFPPWEWKYFSSTIKEEKMLHYMKSNDLMIQLECYVSINTVASCYNKALNPPKNINKIIKYVKVFKNMTFFHES